MSMVDRIIELVPRGAHLHGATLAQKHLAKLLPELSTLTEPAAFILNLENAKSVTGSYLRATVHWAFLCGQTEAGTNGHSLSIDRWAVRPLPLFPAVSGGSPEVVDDVDDFFRARALPLLQITKRKEARLQQARLLGLLDRFLSSTLFSLAEIGEATAAELAEKNNETITVNAWSNRLADLYAHRLVTRRRAGKFWRYSPLAEEIKPWA